MLELVPLALGSALYPSLLAMVVILLGREDPRPVLGAYVTGALIISLAAGGLIIAALEAGNAVGGSDHTVSPTVDISIGVVALLLLWVLLTDRDRRLRERRKHKQSAKPDDGRDPWSKRILDRESVTLTFFLGMALSLPGALYLVALKDIAAADESTAVVVVQLVLFNVVMFALAEAPLVGYLVAPDRTRAVVAGFNGWLGDHSRQIAIALCGAAGVLLIARGVANI
jgi:hypothetical protein